jgi:hypothetical protein
MAALANLKKLCKELGASTGSVIDLLKNPQSPAAPDVIPTLVRVFRSR